ncbi:hypothetical protein GUITHDRAFT_121642 [Guillardia theta CCMP2712]|uniref:Uncharacterized protein n=1 Tax=Guillardia theta (strain CCMP2712) TaxID=905079 RepID=L1I7W2_GUITC|nr:hypothetical protein GUITHDRAFT_121642 [Guillardia theta CCMP2712]EKX32182.1 hypothetical protein GUITHDRAFT_121642 [Guillardia theta CCMP2712]|eukprot:XP_005819162.1 hypothetical protein GUITHDRAFT_121642 [Guillardia theta CCMP2712]
MCEMEIAGINTFLNTMLEITMELIWIEQDSNKIDEIEIIQLKILKLNKKMKKLQTLRQQRNELEASSKELEGELQTLRQAQAHTQQERNELEASSKELEEELQTLRQSSTHAAGAQRAGSKL